MILHVIATNPGFRPAANARAPGKQHFHDILHALVEMGRHMARQAHARAEAGPETLFEVVDLFATATGVVCRAIELDLLLTDADDPALLRIIPRRHVIRSIRDFIVREAGGRAAKGPDTEFRKRLDARELNHEIGDFPGVDAIAEICRDLGHATAGDANPWKPGTPADIAALCIRATALPRPASPA